MILHMVVMATPFVMMSHVNSSLIVSSLLQYVKEEASDIVQVPILLGLGKSMSNLRSRHVRKWRILRFPGK